MLGDSLKLTTVVSELNLNFSRNIWASKISLNELEL
jgi:hypothetical protein